MIKRLLNDVAMRSNVSDDSRPPTTEIEISSNDQHPQTSLRQSHRLPAIGRDRELQLSSGRGVFEMTDRRYSDEEILDMLQRCHEEHDACTPDLFNGMDETCSVSLVARRFGSWLDGKKEAGLGNDRGRTGRKREYSNEDILEHLHKCSRRHDGKCTVSLLQSESDLVTPSVAIKRFGRWSVAKTVAGLGTDERAGNHRPREYSDEDYLELIRECYEKYGKATQRLFNEEADERADHPTANAVRKRFGSWNEAKKEAGIETGAQEYTDAELLDMLRRCRERYGKISASVFAADEEFCAPETLQRRFGSWSQAKEQLESVGK